MKFQKTGGDGALLSVPFVVTNTETGESHIIVTNKGSFNSAEYDGESVNGNDSLIEKKKRLQKKIMITTPEYGFLRAQMANMHIMPVQVHFHMEHIR